MTLPVGVFTALGILAYIILWRYIFLQFFKLVKSSEDLQDSLQETGPKLFDLLFSNCTESSDENHKKSCQIVANISPLKLQSIVLSFEPFSSEIKLEHYVIRSSSISINQIHRKIDRRNRVLREVEHFYKIVDAHKFLKLCSRSGIGRCGRSIGPAEKAKSINPKLEEMEVADNDVKDTRRPGNRMFKDIDGSSGTFEVVECHATPPEIESNVQLGREEKDLNTMIRRLVAAELMKCCEKEHGAMSRAHSDTNNRVNWKRNKYRKQGKNLNANLAISLGESYKKSHAESIVQKKYDEVLSKRIDDVQPSGFVTEKISEGDPRFDSENENCENDKRNVESIAIAEHDSSTSCKSGYSRKRAENEASIEETETQITGTSRADTILEANATVGKFEDASTQTEQMYMIRAVRSCPGRRRRFQLLGTQRGMSKARNSGKNFPIEISLPAFLYRKASDNLIYEKGKGSRSPSYVPVPERFRWRYVMPTKIN